MARLVGAVLLLLIPLLVFNLAGIGAISNSGYFFGTLDIDDPSSFSARNPILTLLGTIAALGIGGAVIAGTFLGRNLDTILAGAAIFALMGVFIAVIQDYILIYNIVKEVSQGFAILILAPIMIASSLFVVEFILKKD